jgi:hypothetical protein
LPHAKVFEQVGIPLTLRVLAIFVLFFLAKLDFFIDLILGHDKRIKKIDTKEQGRIKVFAGPGQLAFWGPLDKHKRRK